MTVLFQLFFTVNNFAHLPYIIVPAFQEELADSRPTLGFSADDVIRNLTVFRNASSNDTTRQQVDELISQIMTVSEMARDIDAQAVSMGINTLSFSLSAGTDSSLHHFTSDKN